MTSTQQKNLSLATADTIELNASEAIARVQHAPRPLGLVSNSPAKARLKGYHAESAEEVVENLDDAVDFAKGSLSKAAHLMSALMFQMS